MSTHPSTPLAVGSQAPDFALPDVLSGQTITLRELRGQIVIVDFWSVECPWSRHYDAYLVERQTAWAAQGIRLLLIDSNTNETVEQMRRQAAELGLNGPLLHDAGNVVADAFGAQTTPHIFLLDQVGRTVYQGAIDDRSFRQRQATTNYLDSALKAILEGRTPDPAETPAYGCAIMRGFKE